MTPRPKSQADGLLTVMLGVLSADQIVTLADVLARAKLEGCTGRVIIDLECGEPSKIHLVHISSENFKAEIRESN